MRIFTFFTIAFTLISNANATESITIGFPTINTGPDGREGGSFTGTFMTSEHASKLQQVFNNSKFATTIPNGGFITQLYFRVDAAWQGEQLIEVSKLKIDLGYATNPNGELSHNFSENGKDMFEVLNPESSYSYPIIQSGQGHTGSAVPLAFDRPFSYDPKLGDLLLSIESDHTGINLPLDLNTSTPELSYLLGYGDTTPHEGNVTKNSGLIISFRISSIPEPTILGLGIVTLLTRSRVRFLRQ